MAGASAGEVRSLMYTVEDCGFASPTVAASFRERAAEVSRIVHAFRVAVIKNAKKRDNKVSGK